MCRVFTPLVYTNSGGNIVVCIKQSIVVINRNLFFMMFCIILHEYVLKICEHIRAGCINKENMQKYLHMYMFLGMLDHLDLQ